MHIHVVHGKQVLSDKYLAQQGKLPVNEVEKLLGFK